MTFGTEPRWSLPTRHIVTVLLGVAWLLVGVAGASELFLVGLAERRVTGSLERDASDVDVDITARPAFTLLAGRADGVVVRARRLRTRASSGDDPAGGLGDLLARTRASGNIDARIDTLVTSRVTLHDVHLVKRGDRLTVAATVTRAAIAAALPRNVALSARPGSRAFQLKAAVQVVGRRVTVRATVAARDGKLVIAPRLGGVTVLTLSLFADPRVAIDSVRARARASGSGYRFEAAGHLT